MAPAPRPHARARDAVHDALDVARLFESVRAIGLDVHAVRRASGDRARYLQRPDLGRRLDSDSRDCLAALPAGAKGAEAAFVIADGLSARAAQAHAAPVLAALAPRLRDASRP